MEKLLPHFKIDVNKVGLNVKFSKVIFEFEKEINTSSILSSLLQFENETGNHRKYAFHRIRTNDYKIAEDHKSIIFKVGEPDDLYDLVITIPSSTNPKDKYSAFSYFSNILGISSDPIPLPEIFTSTSEITEYAQKDEYKKLLSLSDCELSALTASERIDILRKISNVIKSSWIFDDDSHWELARKLLASAPESQYDAIRKYFMKDESKELYDALCEHTDPLYAKSLIERSYNNNGFDMKPEEAAALASHVYGDKDAEFLRKTGWKLSNKIKELKEKKFIHYDVQSGFKSELYEKDLNGETVYCYATAGTEIEFNKTAAGIGVIVGFGLHSAVPVIIGVYSAIGDKGDISEDLMQGLDGTLGPQARISANNALIINEELKGSKVVFVGHSLGGELAIINSLMTGRPAYTFNAAGLKRKTLTLLSSVNQPKIINYVNEGELLYDVNEISNCYYYGGPPIIIKKTGDCKGSHSIDCFLK